MMADITASDFAEQLAARLREVDQKAAKIKSQMGPLMQQRDEALVAGNDSVSVALKDQLKKLQERLEDLEYSKAAAQVKLRVYDQKAPEAAKVRDKANTFWEEGRALIDEFVKIQSRARILYGKTLEVENKISGLGHEHLRLVGRDMRGPPSITGMVYQLGAFAGPSVSDVRPLDAWRYESDEELKAEHQRIEADRFKQYREHLAIANKLAPPCARCGEKTVVDMHAGMKERPGAGIIDGHWSFHCNSCGNGQGGIIPETKRK
jgi:hypothetical protein